MKSVLTYSLFLPFAVMLFFLNITKVMAGMIDKEGMKPWEICGLCHNLNGISHMAKFPKIAGQKKAYIEKQLRDFKTGKRTNDGGQMEAIVNEITMEQIPEVAAWFSSVPHPTPVKIEMDETATKLAKKLFEEGDKTRKIQACSSCHVKENKTFSIAPLLTAQHADYLAKQLHDFKSKDRENDSNAVMQNIAAGLTEKEINSLAEYIASQPR